MEHHGDITKLSGWELPIADIITGGSPCQDLSVAGKRAGLAGERSGLFMEQIRIVREMRERDGTQNERTDEFLRRPRYMVWENVAGAFSSNGGADFQAVLTEIVRIASPEAPDVPMPERGGWPKAGLLYDELAGWSVAWRLHDAQYWGVPQRRKRLCVLADFGGLTAGEILFDPQLRRTTEDGEPVPLDRHSGNGCRPEIPTQPESLPRHPAESGEEREGTAATLGDRPADAGGSGIGEPIPINTMAGTRTTDERRTAMGVGEPGDPEFTLVYENHGQDSRIRELGDVSEGVSAKYGTGGNNTPLVLSVGNGQLNQMNMSDKTYALDTMHDAQAVLVCAPDIGHALRAKGNLQHREDGETYIATFTGETLIYPEVRRLTPKECERLQNFPDDWSRYGLMEDGTVKELPDGARYKLQGNSIARPFWTWLLRRIAAEYERQATLGSLFDGQGGFLLCAQDAGIKPIWASEIEKYAIAVTKYHFPENGGNAWKPEKTESTK